MSDSCASKKEDTEQRKWCVPGVVGMCERRQRGDDDTCIGQGVFGDCPVDEQGRGGACDAEMHCDRWVQN